MTGATPVAAVTGASGYLGSRICEALVSNGWQVIRLVRARSQDQAGVRHYDLAEPISHDVAEVLASADLLVHAAYDLSLTNPIDISRVNVAGTRRLLDAARRAQVGRVLVLSSMSAYAGTTQLYGQAKMAIEAITHASGGCAVRPGLVHGDRAGGMTAALRKLVRLPVIPLIAGEARIYTVHEDDLLAALVALASIENLPQVTVSVAHPRSVSIREVLKALAKQEGRSAQFIPIPWQLVYALLRVTELLRIALPFRADSLLGLVRGAPSVMNLAAVTDLGVDVRPFGVSQNAFVGSERRST